MDHYSTFKPGDRVRIIKPDPLPLVSSDPELLGNGWVGEMDAYVAGIYTLESKLLSGWRMEEIPWGWLPEWFEHEHSSKAAEPKTNGEEMFW